MIANGKAKIENSSGMLSISIPSKKNWFGLLFGTAWMGGWYFGFKFAFITLFLNESHDQGASGFLGFWLLAWTTAGMAIVTALLWGYFGHEKFVSGTGEVFLSKTIFGIGLNKRMEAHEIKNIRTEVGNANWFGRNRWAFWGLGPGKIKFDYGFKTYSFGLALDDAEADYITELMKQNIK